MIDILRPCILNRSFVIEQELLLNSILIKSGRSSSSFQMYSTVGSCGRRVISASGIKFIIVSDFFIVEQVFLSPQVKRSVIISNKQVYTSCLTSCVTI